MNRFNRTEQPESVDPTRRRLLKGLVASGVIVAVGSGVLAACGNPNDDARQEGEKREDAFVDKLKNGGRLEVFPGVLKAGDMVNPRKTPVRVQGQSENTNRAQNIPDDQQLLIVRPYLLHDEEGRTWAGYWDTDTDKDSGPKSLSWIELTNEPNNATLDPDNMSAFTKSGARDLALTQGETVTIMQASDTSPFVVMRDPQDYPQPEDYPDNYDDRSIVDFVNAGAVGMGFRVGNGNVSGVVDDLVQAGYSQGFSSSLQEYNAQLDRQAS